jgi:hypothetical protein
MTGSRALLDKAAFTATAWGTWGLTHVPPLRRAAVAAWQGRLRAGGAVPDPRAPAAVTEDKVAMGLAMVRLAERASSATITRTSGPSPSGTGRGPRTRAHARPRRTRTTAGG